MFSFAVRANIMNRQMAVATALLYDKMEQFKAASLDDPLWKNNDGFEYVTQEAAYMRVWHVNSAIPRSVTVIVYAENALTRRQIELIRATTIVSDTF